MPKRRRSTPYRARKRRKYRYKRRKKSYYKKRSLVLGGFPKSKLVRLRYVTEVGINASIAQNQTYVFRANDLYDPDSSGGGHQPSNFDRWVPSIYNHFTVLGSKIRVTPVTGTSSSVTPTAYYGVLLSDSGAEATSVSVHTLLEQKLSTFSRIPTGVPQGYSGRRSITKSFSARKFFGKKVIQDDSFQGSSSASPTEMAYFEVFCSSVIGNDPAQHHFLIELEYIALLTEPNMDQAS